MQMHRMRHHTGILVLKANQAVLADLDHVGFLKHLTIDFPHVLSSTTCQLDWNHLIRGVGWWDNDPLRGFELGVLQHLATKFGWGKCGGWHLTVTSLIAEDGSCLRCCPFNASG